MPEPDPTVIIRPAAPADAASIHACLSKAFEPYRHLYSLEGYRDTVPAVSAVLERMKTMHLLVAVDDAGAAIGTIAYRVLDTGDGHLRGMAVTPAFQGRGIADQLLARAETSLLDAGCPRVTLDTTEPLHRATRFYRSHGYEPTGVTGDFFGMPLFEYAKVLGRAR